MNRGQMASGHYWTMGWGALWNSSAGQLCDSESSGCGELVDLQFGPGADCDDEDHRPAPSRCGPDLPRGLIESPNYAVQPASLYGVQMGGAIW
jgi:hypothetical protein